MKFPSRFISTSLTSNKNILGGRAKWLALAMIALGAGAAEAQTTQSFTTAGTATWTCPTGVSTVQVEAWGGGGGAGGAGANFASTGGGAGGSYVKVTSIAVTAGTTYNLNVGAAGMGGAGGAAGTGTTGLTGGSSYFGNTTAGSSTGASVLAVGGPGSVGNNSTGVSTTNRTATNGATATNAGNLPTTGAAANFAGTNGANAVTNSNNSGGGGAGAGPSGSAGGGAGGAALTSAGNGKTGTAPGGGGSGGDQSSSASNGTGGTGGVGQIALTFTPASPTITTTGTLSPLLGYQGTACGPTTFVAGGVNLTANITVTAPSGFEISTAQTSGYSSSITLTQTSGAVANTTLYVRLTAADLASTYSGNVTLTSTGATTVNEAVPTSTVVAVSPFTAGNILVQQADNGTSQNTTPTLLELNAAATTTQSSPVQSIPLPSGNINASPTLAQALRINGSGGTSGYLATSNDGTELAIVDQNALSTSDLGQTTAASILNRAIVTFGSSANLTFQAYYTGASGNQARAATTLDNSLWFVADKGGIYITSSASPATTPDSTTNMLNARSFGGQVYGFSGTAPGVTSIVTSGPSIGTLTTLPGLSVASATDFYLLSSGVNGATFDVCYVTTGTSLTAGTINKYSLVSGTWTSNGSYTTSFGGRSIVAAGNGGGATLYLTGADGGTVGASVVKVTDTTGWNQTIAVTTANNVTLYTFPGNAVGKGISFVPLATALPDLTIAVSNPTSSASASFAYTVTVANSGAASASGVNAQFTLPSGLTYVSGTDNGSAGFTVSNSSGVVSINGGTLAAGASDTITVQVTGTTGDTYTVDAGTSASTPGDGFAVINTSATTTTPIAESNANNNSDNVASTTAIASPVINVTGTPVAVSTSYGIPSSPTSFSASGSNLSGNITVTAPTGFEVSTSAGSGYATSLALVPTGATVSATTIYVRLAATTADGNYAGSVTLATPGGATVFEGIPSSTVSPSANLSGLASSAGGLNQAFSASTLSYLQYVPSNVASVTFTTMADTGATVTINGQPASSPVTLNTGANTLTIVVTNGSLTQTYTVTVYRAGAFTPGDLVVTTYGNLATGSIHTDGQTTPITLSEFTPTIAANSTPVMAFALPSSVTGNNLGIAGEYASSSEGTIEQTPDGLYLTFQGYSAVPAFAYTATALAQSPCTTVPRVAGLIDGNTNANTSTAFNDIYNTNNPRGTFSPDDVNFYISGQGAGTGDEGGIYYSQYGTNTANGGSAPTGIFNAVSTREIIEFGGNFYYSCDQNSSKGVQTGIFEYSGLPTVSQGTNPGTQIIPANNSGGTINYSPQGFWFANATTLYVADTGDPKAGGTGNGGIEKWVYNGSQWVLKYTLTTPNLLPAASATTATHGETGFESITGTVNSGVASLYGTTYTAGDGDPNGLYGVTDTLTATSSTATLTEIAAAPGLQASGTNPDFLFKGVSFAPTGSPVNSAAASSITSSGATLNGSINPNGSDTTAYFQYGTSTSLDSTTATTDLGSGTSAVPFGISVSGLQPGTTYYYQLVTVANGLTSTYAIQSFTTAAATETPGELATPAMPPAMLILMAIAMLAVSATLLKRKTA